MILRPSKFSKMGLDFPYMIAPMVGLSHVAFRALIKTYTPPNIHPLCFTEMLSTRRLPSERLDSSRELKISDGEDYFVPQILGNEERFIRPSIEKLSLLSPWGFDINMGCPQSHILKHNWGVRLVGDANYAAQVVGHVKKSTHLPVSVKLRGGADKETDLDYLLKFTEALEVAGLDWLTIHPRPRSASNHEGRANWIIAADIARARNIPVVVNGDLQTAADAVHVVRELGCDGAMIARAATVRPWILWQIAYMLDPDKTPTTFNGRTLPLDTAAEGKEYFRSFLTFIELLLKYFGDNDYSLQKARFFAATGSRWFLFGHSFWRLTMKSKSLLELWDRVSEHAEKSSGEMSQRIDL